MLGQAIVAATRSQPEKEVKTVHMVFSRAGWGGDPLYLVLDTVHAGGSYGTVGVTYEQKGRPIAKGVIMLTVPDPDLIRHARERALPVMDGPDHADTKRDIKGAWDLGTLAGADPFVPGDNGPPEYPMWVRFSGAPVPIRQHRSRADDNAINQALVAYVSNFHLISAAMRPHDLRPEQAHTEVSTGVNSHTVTFHDPVPAGAWFLLDQGAPYAGRGRVYGRGDVFTEDGKIIASYVQDAIDLGDYRTRRPSLITTGTTPMSAARLCQGPLPRRDRPGAVGEGTRAPPRLERVTLWAHACLGTTTTPSIRLSSRV